MSFLTHLVGIAAPIIGGIFGGPVGAAIGGAIGGGINGGAKGALVGGALGFAGGAAAGAFGGGAGGAFEAAGGGVPPNPFAGAGGGFGSGGGAALSGFDDASGFAGGGVSPPNPFAGGAGGGTTGGFFGGGGGIQQTIQNLMQSAGGTGIGNLLGGAAKYGMPLFQIAGGLQGMEQAKKLQKQAQLPNPADVTGMPGYQAGSEAVQRSMAAQGYQGSGNMAAALQKYGGDFYNQFVQQRQGSVAAQAGPITGQMSSLALLSGGLGGFAKAFGQ